MVAYSFKKQFVDPIRAGLGHYEHIDGMIPAPKRQTIRANGKRRHARPGETLQLYSAMRTKQCFKIGEATCTEVVPISIDVRKDGLLISSGRQRIIGGTLIDNFARLDGFADGKEMRDFWLKEHGLGKFEGVLIRWQ